MDVRTAIWLKRIDAKANIRYFGDLEDRYAWWLRGLQCTVLICTGGAAITAARSSVFWLTQVLAIVAAIATATLMAFRIADAVSAAKSSMRHWVRRDVAWDLLWLAIEMDSGAVDARRLDAEIRADREFDPPQVPWDAKLALRAEQDTYRALGLPLPAL